jgi:hypothetical protein
VTSLDPQLAAAFARMQARKQATDDDSRLFGVQMDPHNATAFIGSDVRVEQALFLGDLMATAAIGAVMIGESDLENAFVGIWVDGFLVGLELARIRAEETAAKLAAEEAAHAAG